MYSKTFSSLLVYCGFKYIFSTCVGSLHSTLHLCFDEEWHYEKITVDLCIKLGGKKVTETIAKWQSSLIWNIFFLFLNEYYLCWTDREEKWCLNTWHLKCLLVDGTILGWWFSPSVYGRPVPFRGSNRTGKLHWSTKDSIRLINSNTYVSLKSFQK